MRLNLHLKKLSLAIFTAMLVITPNASAFSLSDTILDYMDKAGIYYYNPSGFANNCYPGLGSYDGVTTAGLSSLQAAFIDQYHDIATTLATEHNIPWEAVMAQGIIESASGTSHIAVDKNNFFGIGAIDSDPYNHAYSYSSATEGWEGYFNFIEQNSRYKNAGAFNHAGDPYGYISALKTAGYATDPNYVSKVSSYINAVKNRATEKGWSTSSDLAKTASSSAYVTASLHFCNSYTYGNGDINATALALSWSDRSHNLNAFGNDFLVFRIISGQAKSGEIMSRNRFTVEIAGGAKFIELRTVIAEAS